MELQLGNQLSVGPLYLGVDVGGNVQDNRIVGGILFVMVFQPVGCPQMDSTPLILILALKKSGPASGFGSPGSMISNGSPWVVTSVRSGKSLCFHT